MKTRNERLHQINIKFNFVTVGSSVEEASWRRGYGAYTEDLGGGNRRQPKEAVYG